MPTNRLLLAETISKWDLNEPSLEVVTAAKVVGFPQYNSTNVLGSTSASPDVDITHAKLLRSGDVSSGDPFPCKQCDNSPVFGDWVSSGSWATAPVANDSR